MKNGFFGGSEKARYIDLYRNLFESQADEYGLDGQRLWLPVDPSITQDVDAAVCIARRAFKSIEVGREQMVGRCFARVCEASFALCVAKIRHSVTVGNVYVDKRLHYATTPDSIARDMEERYLHDEPAVAHSWITLENGVVLDFTILYSIAYRERKRSPKLIKGIYRSDEPSVRSISHVPMLLGPMYDLLVASMPNTAAYHKACNWASLIVDLVDGEKTVSQFSE